MTSCISNIVSSEVGFTVEYQFFFNFLVCLGSHPFYQLKRVFGVIEG